MVESPPGSASSGVHSGPFLGLPPTGRSIEFEEIDVLRLRGDKISDHWVVVDQLDLMRQPGAISA